MTLSMSTVYLVCVVSSHRSSDITSRFHLVGKENEQEETKTKHKTSIRMDNLLFIPMVIERDKM